MRAAATVFLSVALLAGSLGLGTGCVPDRKKETDLLKPPKSWQPKDDSMTFGSKNLDAFNSMSPDDREAHVEALKGKAGAFKGQAQFERGSELGAGISNSQYGKFEATAQVREPVLYEITIDYELFAAEKLGHGYPSGTYVGFTGTVVEVEYREEAKPRKLIVKLKDVSMERLGS